MSMITRAIVLGAAVASLAHSARAQRGTPGSPPRVPSVPPRIQMPVDTGKKSTVHGVSLDFQDQELRVVLDALAAAGDLNVTMTNIPSQKVTLHMGRPVTREGMAELVKNVAEANGLKVVQSATIMQISGARVDTAPVEQLRLAQMNQQLQNSQPAQMRLFTYRLKHASAVQLAPVLTNLFAGFNGVRLGGTTVFPNGNGGFTTINTPTNGPPGNITTGATTIVPPFTQNGGRGGGRGGANQAATVFQQLGGALSGQAGDIRIIAEESSNSLLIRATDADYALVQQVLGGVDLRPLQVLIEVTIAEVQRTHDLDIGVSGTASRTPAGKTAADVTASAPSQSSSRDFIVALTGGHGTINYNVAIAALQERGDVRVLSLPVIIAQNNRQATLNVGSSRPFVQVSQTIPNDPTGRVQTVQYIDVGTVLTITPTINPDGYVNLQVSQSDNSATNEIQFSAPVITKREATTQIFIRDGQTTVIGGLAGRTHSSDVSGIPFLSRIPFIGPLLFGRTTRSEATTELFLFLTPHVIFSDDDVDKVRDAVHDGSDLLKEVDVAPRFVPKTDTLRVRPDSVRRPPVDSMTTLRRRPPESVWR